MDHFKIQTIAVKSGEDAESPIPERKRDTSDSKPLETILFLILNRVIRVNPW